MAILEYELIERIKPHLEKKYRIYEEVGLFSRSIDMILFDGKKKIISIEFKINDWRKAVAQIKEHMIAADYAYLCMPKKKISLELKILLEENGIGLWLYDLEKDELCEIISPRKSYYQNCFYKNLIIKYLLNREIALHEC